MGRGAELLREAVASEGRVIGSLLMVDGFLNHRVNPPLLDAIGKDLGDRFADVAPGTRLTFRILLFNDLIPQTDAPQRFLMWVVLRGDGVTRLSETLVQVVVPALGGGGCDEL